MRVLAETPLPSPPARPVNLDGYEQRPSVKGRQFLKLTQGMETTFLHFSIHFITTDDRSWTGEE